MLTIGDYVIMNDTDRPCAGLLAVLTEQEGEWWKAIYLSVETTVVRPQGNKPTPLSDFGQMVEWSPCGNFYRVMTWGDSGATYADGRPRKWQESDDFLLWKRARSEAQLYCKGVS